MARKMQMNEEKIENQMDFKWLHYLHILIKLEYE